MADEKKILYCRCQYANVVPKKVKDEVLARLAQEGQAFQAVPDLCEMSARKDPVLHKLNETHDLHIIACFPRAVKSLFRAANAPLTDDNTQFHNMRAETTEQIMESLSTAPALSEKSE